MKNKVKIAGKVITREPNHINKYGQFFKSIVEVQRVSGIVDKVNIVYPESFNISVEDEITIEGPLRTYTKDPSTLAKGETRLFLYVDVEDVRPFEESINSVEFEGEIVKQPILRVTPKGKDICDVLLKNVDDFRKAYVPTIVWKDLAKKVSEAAVGDTILIKGNLQSREYNKVIDEDTLTITTFELNTLECELN